MDWYDLPATIDDWHGKASAPSMSLRETSVRMPVRSHVGYYYHPVLEKVALFAPLAQSLDRDMCKRAADNAVGASNVLPLFLSYQELCDPDGQWIKVAYSDSIRRTGELLNFFPGQYPGGIPNHPSPVAAMLTTGLLGAGAGWGLGRVLRKLLPGRFGENLGRTGALLGGAVGMAPGAAWGLTNKGIGKGFNDSTLLAASPHTEPQNFEITANGTNAPAKNYVPLRHDNTVSQFASQLQNQSLRGFGKRGEDTRYAKAIERVKMAFADAIGGGLVAVNVNALGQTLWNTGASPQLAGTTMGAMYAAQQMPDPDSRPGLVTARQLGRLAGDYTRGALVGAALNAVVGTPWPAGRYGLGNVALGIVGAVVPKLFGA